MAFPEALKKHDNRIVAFDLQKLADSIAHAAIASETLLQVDVAQRLSLELASAVGEFLIVDGKNVPISADVRAMVFKILKETRHDPIANAYSEHARNAAGLLWRIRVVDVEPLLNSTSLPWDRRRLLESLRKVGVARDPAGTVARDVERRLVSLAQERVSPALIHALAALVLTEQGIDPRPYNARRLAFSLSAQLPHYDAGIAKKDHLPENGAALEAFWLQAIHSPEVVRAVRENALSLSPYPHTFDNAKESHFAELQSWLDPLTSESTMDKMDTTRIRIRADGDQRLTQLAKRLTRHSLLVGPESGKRDCYYDILLKTPLLWNLESVSSRLSFASAVTINLAGMLIRDVLRDPAQTTSRIAHIVRIAAQVHREREEYFKQSPVRGRLLPIALAGVWNAVAWLQGQSVETSQLTKSKCAVAVNLIGSVKVAIDNLRSETGMELILVGFAPQEAVEEVWASDREFLRRDGVSLSVESIYDNGPSLVVSTTAGDTGNASDWADRIDFIADISRLFDEPPSVILRTPLGVESDVSRWQEMLFQFAQAGVQRLSLYGEGGTRSMKFATKMLRSHVEGYPLFEQTEG